MHQLAEVIRFRYGLALPPSEEARSLIKVGRVIWDGRDRLIQPLATRDETPPNDRIRRDLLDIIVLWADLHTRFAPPTESAAAKQEALRILTEAKALFGNSPALERDRRTYAAGLGIEETPALDPPQARTAWEHFDLGKWYLKSGESELAASEFRAGLRSPARFLA